jgi:hypothetical protein
MFWIIYLASGMEMREKWFHNFRGHMNKLGIFEVDIVG